MKKSIFIIAAAIISIAAFFMVREYMTLNGHNICPLHIETFDGHNSPYHPSVLFFEEGFASYRFWMSETPFPSGVEPYTDRWECPSIHVSEDGYNWSVPDNLTNPIEDLTDTEIKDMDFFSDPHLFMKGDTMECWYRKTLRHGIRKYHTDNADIYLFRKTSTDGIHWSQRDTLANILENWDAELLSPSLIYDNGYKMWAVINGDKSKEIILLKSEDARNWDSPMTCVFTDTIPNPWHIDVQYIDGCWWLVDYEQSECIDLYKSNDGLNFSFVKTLVQSGKVYGAMDEWGLYRASLVKVSDTDYRLYYSTRSRFCTHIALLQGESMENMRPVNIGNGTYRSFFSFVGMSCKRIWVRFILEVEHIWKNG